MMERVQEEAPAAAVLEHGVVSSGRRGREGLRVADVPVSEELVKYYRSVVDGFERERAEYLHRLEGIEVSAAEVHRCKWELRKREEEIAELQKTLSDTQVYFMEEREHNLKLQAENDAMKIQELEDRKRIRGLLEGSQPVHQEDITFFRGSKPERTRYYPVRKSVTTTAPATTVSQQAKKKTGSSVSVTSSAPKRTTVEYEDLVQRQNQSMSLRRREKADREATPDTYERDTYSRSRMVPGQTYGTEKVAAQRQNQQGVLPPRKEGPETVREVPVNSNRILRTMTITSDHSEALVLTVESLRSQLEEQAKLFEEQKSTLMEDRRVLMEEHRTREQQLRSEIASMDNDNKKLREMLRKNTSEFLHLRHNAAVSMRALREELAGTVLMNKELLEKLEVVRQGKLAESETLAKTTEEKCEQFMHHFRKQAVSKEEELSAKLQEFVDREGQFRKRIEELQGKLKGQKNSYKDLEKRRMFDMMGFRNDVFLLNKHIRALEGKFQRLISGNVSGSGGGGGGGLTRSASASSRHLRQRSGSSMGDSEEENIMRAINQRDMEDGPASGESVGVGISSDLTFMRSKLDKMVRDIMQRAGPQQEGQRGPSAKGGGGVGRAAASASSSSSHPHPQRKKRRVTPRRKRAWGEAPKK